MKHFLLIIFTLIFPLFLITSLISGLSGSNRKSLRMTYYHFIDNYNLVSNDITKSIEDVQIYTDNLDFNYYSLQNGDDVDTLEEIANELLNGVKWFFNIIGQLFSITWKGLKVFFAYVSVPFKLVYVSVDTLVYLFQTI